MEVSALFERDAVPGASVVWFTRSGQVDEEPFEEDLVLVNRETRWVMVLNRAGQALWDALRWPQSFGTLLELLVEARPEARLGDLVNDVTAYVHTLAIGEAIWEH